MEKIYLNRKARIVLEDDTYKGIQYVIVTYGSHPCCYVAIPEDSKLHECEDEFCDEMCAIDVHGGITLVGTLKSDIDEDFNSHFGDRKYMGWDYAHLNDFYSSETFPQMGRKHTIDELRDECKYVIDQILNQA